jgi:hypothetical protein
MSHLGIGMGIVALTSSLTVWSTEGLERTLYFLGSDRLRTQDLRPIPDCELSAKSPDHRQTRHSPGVAGPSVGAPASDR